MSSNMKNYSKIFTAILVFIISAINPIMAFAGPSSINYKLEQYSFGAGGEDSMASGTYGMSAILGEVESGQLSSTNFKVNSGLYYTMMANVPPAPSISNPSNYYNRLKIVINEGGNASDALYAVAISTDNFVSDTKYIQDDNTISSTLGIEDWRTYSGVGGWGGASGIIISGLSPNTTYTVKAAAKKGSFTESGYGPTSQAATILPTLSFDIDVSTIDEETSAPYTLDIGTLTPASVITSTAKIWIDLTTNANSGGAVYVYGANSGLASTTAGSSINSSTTDLTGASSGYGVRSNSVGQTSGGPLRSVAPYNGAGNNVGVLDVNKRIIYDSSDLPVSGGRGAFELKAKSSDTTPAATDYSDIITIIASGSF